MDVDGVQMGDGPESVGGVTDDDDLEAGDGVALVNDLELDAGVIEDKGGEQEDEVTGGNGMAASPVAQSGTFNNQK